VDSSDRARKQGDGVIYRVEVNIKTEKPMEEWVDEFEKWLESRDEEIYGNQESSSN